MTALTVDLRGLLHAGQQEIAASPARFKVVACGRRFGKTYLGVASSVAKGLSGRRSWWVAPTYKQALEGWLPMTALARQVPSARIIESELEVKWPGGGISQVRTAHDPQALRGAGLDHVTLDEAAYIQPIAWHEVLRPALAERRGEALFISSPRGRNWFWELWEDAHRLEGWAAWQKPTSDNPYVPAEEIQLARKQMGEAAFAQEYEASFEVIANAIYPTLAWDKHFIDLPKDARFEGGAIGVDYGTVHLSTSVVVQRDTLGRVWVRECWAKAGGDLGDIEMAVKGQRTRYKCWSTVVDPIQAVLAQNLAAVTAKTGAGSRKQRISRVEKLLGADALFFDRNGAGVQDLFREATFYRYERRETDFVAEDVVVRKDDDRVAGLEYAIEALMEHGDPVQPAARSLTYKPSLALAGARKPVRGL